MLEDEKKKLKQMLVDTMLENMATKDILSKKQYRLCPPQHCCSPQRGVPVQRETGLHDCRAVPKQLPVDEIRSLLHELAEQRRKFGISGRHTSATQGNKANHKHSKRRYLAEGLKNRKKRFSRSRVVMAGRHELINLSMDFDSDSLFSNKGFHVLTVEYVFSRECRYLKLIIP